jgi:hypothetical protein
MARPLRTSSYQPGDRAFLHLLNHLAGVERDIPLTAADKTLLRRIFRKYLPIYNVVLIALIIMGNHYHLMVDACRCRLSDEEVTARWRKLYGEKEPPPLPGTKAFTAFRARLDDVSALLHDVQGIFTRQYNTRHHRHGTLWQGRFRSYRLPDLRALFRCFVYIEGNALRAGMVAHPRLYHFGTYRQWVQAAGDPPVLVLLRELCGATEKEYPRKLFFDEVEEIFTRIIAERRSAT